MSARTEVVPFWWTSIDGLGAQVGASVTPFKIPAASLNGSPSWRAMQVVQLPLSLSAEPATVARFFRDGYEWVDVPEDVTSGTLVELFAELFARDKVRFAHFDPLLVTATQVTRDIAEVKAKLGGHMVPKPDPNVGADPTKGGFSPPDWLIGVHTGLTAAGAVLSASSLTPFEDLARLHFDYWGNSEWRCAILSEIVVRVVPPSNYDFSLGGLLSSNFPLTFFSTGSFHPGDALLAAFAPQALPLKAHFGTIYETVGTTAYKRVVDRDVRMPKVLARKPLAGVPIKAVATEKGRATANMSVVSIDPPLIELDGWSTQTIAPIYLNSWKTRESLVRFRITLPVSAAKTVIEIVHHRRVVYAESHDFGPFIVPGVHLWEWDGFDLDQVFDTALLKSNELVARVTVVDLQGRVGVAKTELGTSAGNIRWADAKIDRKNRTIDVSAFMRFSSPSELTFASVTIPLPKGTGAAFSKVIDTVGSTPGLSLVPLFPDAVKDIPEDVDTPPPWVPAFKKDDLGRLLNDDHLALSLPVPKVFDLDPITFGMYREAIIQGISERWSREVTIDGAKWALRVQCTERHNDSFRVFLTAAAPKALNALGLKDANTPFGQSAGSRPFNLAAIAEGLPIIYIYNDLVPPSVLNMRDTGAHEFGHSVLREAYDPLTSCCHKGITTPWGADIVTRPKYPAADGTDPSEPKVDIMFYYSGSDDQRTWATEDDARALVWMCKVIVG